MTSLKGKDQKEGTQQKTSRIVQPGLKNENPALREVDFFLLSLREGVFTPKGLPALKHGSKMNRDNKSPS